MRIRRWRNADFIHRHFPINAPPPGQIALASPITLKSTGIDHCVRRHKKALSAPAGVRHQIRGVISGVVTRLILTLPGHVIDQLLVGSSHPSHKSAAHTRILQLQATVLTYAKADASVCYRESLKYLSARTHMRPMGWLISVQSPEASHRPIYATVADTHERAKVLVQNYCSITNETIRLERILTDGEIKLLGLQPGEVKLYAT